MTLNLLNEEEYINLCEVIMNSDEEEFALSICDLEDNEEIGYLMRLARRLNNDLEVQTQWTLFSCEDCGRTNGILEIRK